MDLLNACIGQRLRNSRLAAGLTQSDLGSIVDVSFQQVQKYERGLNRVSAVDLYHFAKALDVPIAYFFEDMDASSNAKAPTLEVEMLSLTDPTLMKMLRIFVAIEDPKIKESIFKLLKSIDKNR